MHRGHHDHDHGGLGGHGPNGHHHDHTHGPGHNGPRQAVQWQTPHLPEGAADPAPPVADLDLVETSFVEGFTRASDATSFLRLAGIPFVGEDGAGRQLHLLRVEINDVTDVASVVPLLGGQGARYDPLPARFMSRRRSLAFAYHDGQAVVRLGFAAARALADRSNPSQFGLSQDH